MSKVATNAVGSVMVVPVSNQGAALGSLLPDRFVSDSRAQMTPIVAGDLGSVSAAKHPRQVIVLPVSNATTTIE